MVCRFGSELGDAGCDSGLITISVLAIQQREARTQSQIFPPYRDLETRLSR